MNEPRFLNFARIYMEISQDRLKVLRENDGLEIPLERSPSGQLTAACKEKIAIGLHNFHRRKAWQPRLRALCAIGAGGLSLRRMALPAAAREEFPKLLRLQIESEFPLSPDELVWDYRTLAQPAGNGAPARQEILVAAVRRERIEEYARLFFAAGLNPAFTPAALARGYLCADPIGSGVVLELQGRQIELVSFQNGVPGAVRVVPWETETRLPASSRLDALMKAIGSQPAGSKVYLAAHEGTPGDLVEALRSAFSNGVQFEKLNVPGGAGRSAAVLGLKRALEENLQPAPLFFQAATKPSRRPAFQFSEPLPRQWMIRAAVLLSVLLAWPYLEAFLLKPHLAKKLAAVQSRQGTLSAIDHEFEFLRFLKEKNPPYLDALYLFAKAAPPGMRLESTSMNRRGEVSLRGAMHDAQQVTDFRSKLMDSGFFERVTVEEQVPTPDHQKVNVRISAQWKPYEARAGLSIGPTHDEIEKARTNAVARANSPTPAGFPPGRIFP